MLIYEIIRKEIKGLKISQLDFRKKSGIAEREYILRLVKKGMAF